MVEAVTLSQLYPSQGVQPGCSCNPFRSIENLFFSIFHRLGLYVSGSPRELEKLRQRTVLALNHAPNVTSCQMLSCFTQAVQKRCQQINPQIGRAEVGRLILESFSRAPLDPKKHAALNAYLRRQFDLPNPLYRKAAILAGALAIGVFGYRAFFAEGEPPPPSPGITERIFHGIGASLGLAGQGVGQVVHLSLKGVGLAWGITSPVLGVGAWLTGRVTKNALWGVGETARDVARVGWTGMCVGKEVLVTGVRAGGCLMDIFPWAFKCWDLIALPIWLTVLAKRRREPSAPQILGPDPEEGQVLQGEPSRVERLYRRMPERLRSIIDSIRNETRTNPNGYFNFIGAAIGLRLFLSLGDMSALADRVKWLAAPGWITYGVGKSVVQGGVGITTAGLPSVVDWCDRRIHVLNGIDEGRGGFAALFSDWARYPVVVGIGFFGRKAVKAQDPDERRWNRNVALAIGAAYLGLCLADNS